MLDLNEGKLRTFHDGFNIGCNGVGMSGRKLMRGDMKCALGLGLGLRLRLGLGLGLGLGSGLGLGLGLG